MNLAARMNLQRGIAENKVNEWTNYSIENPLDAYLVQKQDAHKRINQARREEQQQKAFEEYLSKMIEGKLEGCLENALGSVLKSLE